MNWKTILIVTAVFYAFITFAYWLDLSSKPSFITGWIGGIFATALTYKLKK